MPQTGRSRLIPPHFHFSTITDSTHFTKRRPALPTPKTTTQAMTTTLQLKNPVKAIRAKCLDCSDGNSNEVKNCQIPSCPIFPFRLGKNPFRQKRELSPEQKAAAALRLQAARKKLK